MGIHRRTCDKKCVLWITENLPRKLMKRQGNTLMLRMSKAPTAAIISEPNKAPRSWVNGTKTGEGLQTVEATTETEDLSEDPSGEKREMERERHLLLKSSIRNVHW